MTPIPLGQHIASWLLPGDQPFPPRFALVLTLVANGAAVKATLVGTIKYLMAVEKFLLCEMNEGIFFPNKTVAGTLWSERCSYLSQHNQPLHEGEGIQIKF